MSEPSLREDADMGIISMIIVGFIVGLLARAIMPGDQKLGIIMTIILGIIGSVVAGYIGGAIGWYEPGEGAGWIGSIVGALIVLFVVGLVSRKT
jgi:Predicted membrane protein